MRESTTNRMPYMKTAQCGAAHFEASSEADPIRIHYINAVTGHPVTACQTPAVEGVKPQNTDSHNHGRYN